MASLTFPLSLATFWNVLRLEQVSFNLGEAIQMNQTRGGEIVTAKLGNRLWSGTASLVPSATGAGDAVRALMDLIAQPGASFHAYDPRRIRPQAGWGQGANTVTVHSVATDRREITIAGNLLGNEIRAGDHLSIIYGVGRLYYGRVVRGASFVAGTPVTAQIEVVPVLPIEVTVDDVVRLSFPYLKAVYVPGSFSGGERLAGFDAGYSFRFMQTLR